MMRRARRITFPAGLAATALVAAACGSGGGLYGGGRSATSTPTTAPSTLSAAPGPTSRAIVAPGDSSLGEVIVDGSGLTLYLFESDTTATSTCYDYCAQTWPPLLATGSPHATGDVNSGDLATTKRRDGTAQITFHGHPLYYFAGDAKPGDTAGEGLSSFGARWYVVGVDGTKIDMPHR